MQNCPSGAPRGEKVICSRLKVREEADTALRASCAQGRVSEEAAAPGLWTTGGASAGRSLHDTASEAGGSRTVPAAAQTSTFPSSWERELPPGRLTVYTMTARKSRGVVWFEANDLGSHIKGRSVTNLNPTVLCLYRCGKRDQSHPCAHLQNTLKHVLGHGSREGRAGRRQPLDCSGDGLD